MPGLMGGEKTSEQDEASQPDEDGLSNLVVDKPDGQHTQQGEARDHDIVRSLPGSLGRANAASEGGEQDRRLHSQDGYDAQRLSSHP